MAPTIEAQLGQFLSRPWRFDWDGLHCCMFMADWIRERRGIDVAEGFRKPLGGQRGAALLVHRHGGLAAFLRALAARAQLDETDAPRAGDVGLVELLTPDGVMPVGAICTGFRWAALQPAGLVVKRAEPLLAWRV